MIFEKCKKVIKNLQGDCNGGEEYASDRACGRKINTI